MTSPRQLYVFSVGIQYTQTVLTRNILADPVSSKIYNFCASRPVVPRMHCKNNSWGVLWNFCQRIRFGHHPYLQNVTFLTTNLSHQSMYRCCLNNRVSILFHFRCGLGCSETFLQKCQSKLTGGLCSISKTEILPGSLVT